MEFELNLSTQELQTRATAPQLEPIKMLTPESMEYKQLSPKQKLVLLHLVRASIWVEKAYYKMENKYNIDFQEFLKKEIKNNNIDAKLTSILYYAQKSMFSPDCEGNFIKLVKNIDEPIAKNFYPTDLSIERFHSILLTMLKRGKIAEVKKVLSQHTMVEYHGDELHGIEYVEYFKEEFCNCANELRLAIQYCEDSDFAQFLDYQAKALTEDNQEYDCMADTLWAKLSNTIFDFTLTRECYDDQMTQSINNNEILLNELKRYDIKFYAKDTIGARVGIINKEGTKFLNDTNKILDIIAQNMPMQKLYNQNINAQKQMGIDLDIVCLTGGEGTCQAGVTVAQNSPNDDKLAVIRGGDRKNVFHRQVRHNRNQKVISAILNPNQLKYYDTEADHWGVICHENTHSLGPKNAKLGEYTSIFEEFKADLGALAYLPEFESNKVFDNVQCKKIACSFLIDEFQKQKPTSLAQAHGVQRVMLLNRMMEGNAISISSTGIITINFENVDKTAKKAMEEIINIQLSNSTQKAKEYLKKYYQWTDELENVAKNMRQHSKKLNNSLDEPLKEYLLTDKAEKEIKALL